MAAPEEEAGPAANPLQPAAAQAPGRARKPMASRVRLVHDRQGQPAGPAPAFPPPASQVVNAE